MPDPASRNGRPPQMALDDIFSSCAPAAELIPRAGAEMELAESESDWAAIVYPAPPPTNNATLAATATGASQERLEIGATLIASESTEVLIAPKSGLAAPRAGSFPVNAAHAWSFSVPLNSLDISSPLFLTSLCCK